MKRRLLDGVSASALAACIHHIEKGRPRKIRMQAQPGRKGRRAA